jgi:hypothetical protein
MEIALGCGAFTEKHSCAILSPTMGITLDRVSDSGSLRNLSGKRRRDSMKVMLWRTKMLNGGVNDRQGKTLKKYRPPQASGDPL